MKLISYNKICSRFFRKSQSTYWCLRERVKLFVFSSHEIRFQQIPTVSIVLKLALYRDDNDDDDGDDDDDDDCDDFDDHEYD